MGGRGCYDPTVPPSVERIQVSQCLRGAGLVTTMHSPSLQRIGQLGSRPSCGSRAGQRWTRSALWVGLSQQEALLACSLTGSMISDASAAGQLVRCLSYTRRRVTTRQELQQLYAHVIIHQAGHAAGTSKNSADGVSHTLPACSTSRTTLAMMSASWQQGSMMAGWTSPCLLSRALCWLISSPGMSCN